VIDPYAKVNARIRDRRRAQGRRDDEYDALIRAASHEMGAATEAMLGIFLDVAERVGLRYLEEAARAGAKGRLRWTPDAVRAARVVTARMPGATGRAVSQSSEWAIKAGFSVLRELRRRLEDTRRGMGSRGDRGRGPAGPTAPRGARPSAPRPPERPPERPRRPEKPPERPARGRGRGRPTERPGGRVE
jgi:hypothetical protein